MDGPQLCLERVPEAKLPTQMSLPSFPGFRQCDAQTLDRKEEGRRCVWVSCFTLLSESLIYFRGFVASAPASLNKQGFLAKEYAYFNAFDMKIAKLPSDVRLCSSLHSRQLFRTFPHC